jgi:hypothetical protein
LEFFSHRFTNSVSPKSAVEGGDRGKKENYVLGVGCPKRHIGPAVRAAEKLRRDRESRESADRILILRWDGGVDRRVIDVGFQTLK